MVDAEIACGGGRGGGFYNRLPFSELKSVGGGGCSELRTAVGDEIFELKWFLIFSE